jgi:hypothetical protein
MPKQNQDIKFSKDKITAPVGFQGKLQGSSVYEPISRA